MKFSTGHKGVVAAGHNTTADVASEVLKAGGNAFDAAAAALFATFIAEPFMGSPGGGGFATLITESGQSYVLDFFCQTPKSKLPASKSHFYPITVDFGEAKEDFYIGHGSHATPGIIAGIFEMVDKFGTMPISELIQPTLDAISNGVPLDPFQQMDIGLLEDIIKTDSVCESIFFPNGKMLEINEPVVMPDLPDFLFSLGKEGMREFYEGEIARKISEASEEYGGHIRMADFLDYKVELKKPLSFNYKDNQIFTVPFPSLGGPVIALGMDALSEIEKPIDYLTAEATEMFLPVIKKMERTIRRPEILAAHLDLCKNIRFNKKWGSTTHFGISDSKGNSVSLTCSNGEGSGYIIPGTNCLMNNMLGEAALLPDGFFSWKKDARLNSLMSPSIVQQSNRRIIIGTGGAGRIPSMILQVIRNMVDGGMDIKEAVEFPRMHLVGNSLKSEPGFERCTFNEDLIHDVWKEKSLYFGGVHTVSVQNGVPDAVGDARRWGVSRIVT